MEPRLKWNEIVLAVKIIYVISDAVPLFLKVILL